MRKQYSLSFVGEVIFSEQYKNHTAGRVEVYNNSYESPYADSEIRIFAPSSTSLKKFIEDIDFKDVTKDELSQIKQTIMTTFNIFSDKYKEK